jgi:hypothetical protein
MGTVDTIYAPRAVNHYDSEHVMPEEDLKKLPEAAIQAPTSLNIQHWRSECIGNTMERVSPLGTATHDASVNGRRARVRLPAG